MFMKPSLSSFAFFFILPLILFSCLWNSLGLLLKNTCLKNLDLFLKKKMKGKRLVPLKILLNSHDHIKYRMKEKSICFHDREMYLTLFVYRNYHVFYYLLLGVNEEERKEFHLKQPEDYSYLNQVICNKGLQTR